jgi:hypothetical protein
MVSRVGIAVGVLVISSIAVGVSAARQPPTGTAMYVARHDPRLCPSPLCGGYWLAIANGARTRCSDGLRRVRCYVARAVDANDRALADIPEGALVRGAIDAWEGGPQPLDELVASAAYAPAGKAAVGGGFYRVVDNGIRCVRAPCFSFRVTPINGSVRIVVSSVDLAAAGASSAEIARAQATLHSKNGLYARGRFARSADGGKVFSALRLYLRAPLPRA